MQYKHAPSAGQSRTAVTRFLPSLLPSAAASAINAPLMRIFVIVWALIFSLGAVSGDCCGRYRTPRIGFYQRPTYVARRRRGRARERLIVGREDRRRAGRSHHRQRAVDVPEYRAALGASRRRNQDECGACPVRDKFAGADRCRRLSTTRRTSGSVPRSRRSLPITDQNAENTRYSSILGARQTTTTTTSV